MADSTIARFSKIATDPLRNFRFLVTFTPQTESGDTGVASSKITAFKGGFTNVGGLGVSIQPIAYREGGMNTTMHQVPGQASFENITLGRGVIVGNDEAISWVRTMFAAAAGEGINPGTNKSFRCKVTIEVIDHPVPADSTIADASKKMIFTVHNAWISNLRYSDLSASGNELLMESISLAHEGISFELKNTSM